MPSLKLNFFGPPQVTLDGAHIELTTRKALALLAYITLNRHAHSRDTLASLFWPESPTDRAFANLRDTLWVLKKRLTHHWFDIRRHEVEMMYDSTLRVDVFEFRRYLDQTSDHEHAASTACTACLPSLLAAIDLYTDDFLQGFTLPDCSAFDEWQASQTDLYREQLVESLKKVVQYAASQHDLPQAIHYARRWVTLCSWSEAAHRELMRVYAFNHQRSAALQQYQVCAQILQEEFEAEPEHETQELYEAILNEDLTPDPSPGRRGEQNSLSLRERVGVRVKKSEGEVAPPHNLPAHTTSFIGRETDIAAVEQMLARSGIRLVTLIGPGGTGKTRLVLRVAEHVIEQFTHGVFFVSLAPISNSDLVVPTIVQTLGLQVAGDTSPLEVLKGYLRNKDLLLVLDNFEQILAAASVLVDLLAAAPDVKMLVTSRTVLHVSGEHEYLVSPLTLPTPTALPSLEQLTQSEAVQLFAERAQAVHRDFRLTEENTLTVAEICTRVDGLPLAIELAAARVKFLPPQKMLTHLGKPLDFLTGGAKDLPVRQHTLRQTIAWSYYLLDTEEQTLFWRCAVFVGGWTLEAAETVCPLNDDIDVFTGLESLLDNNLVKQIEGEHEPRFVMLETIREYALERLTESSEEDAIHRQHARFFLALAEEAEQWWRTFEQPRWLARLGVEHENLRAALGWSLDQAIENGVRLAGALFKFWQMRALYTEGRNWLAHALARSHSSGTGLDRWRAKALFAASALAREQGDVMMARTLGEESLALWRTVGETHGIAQVLRDLGLFEFVHGDCRRARILLEESITLFRHIGEKKDLSGALWIYADLLLREHDYEHARVNAEESHTLGRETGIISTVAFATSVMGDIATYQGEYPDAQAFYEDGLKLFRKIDWPGAIVFELTQLGAVSDMQGHYEQARVWYEEGFEIAQKRGEEHKAAWGLSGLGRVALHQHHWSEARTHFVKSLAVFQNHDDKPGMVACLVGLAGVLEAQGQTEQAAQVLGATETFPKLKLSVTFYLKDITVQAEYDRTVSAVRSVLGEEAFKIAFAKGRDMPLDQAIAFALENQQGDLNG